MKKLTIKILDAVNKNLHIEGFLSSFSDDAKCRILVRDHGKDICEKEMERCPVFDKPEKSGERMLRMYSFSADLPAGSGASYTFHQITDSGKIKDLEPKYSTFSHLTGLPGSYFIKDGMAFTTDGEKIEVSKAGLLRSHSLKKSFDGYLRSEGRDDILELRKRAEDIRKSGKPVMLVSDRTDAAGDNGEALFRYLIENDYESRYDISFLISSESADYKRMGTIGKVLAPWSEEHRVYTLAAKYIVSSAADAWILNPFGIDMKYYRDMLDYRFCFLQHGIIKDDLSDWLHKFKKNMSMFVTSVKPEYESIVHGGYGYDESVVRMTGLARYDRLTDDRKKIISFCPTWRKALAPDVIPGSSDREYSEDFKDSEYCRFYNALINDERLISVMKDAGYKGVFYIHPSHREQARDFTGNDQVAVWNGLTPYSKVFSESSLLVTDYSSVAFDFAYMDKPVIYAQFDSDTFYEGHSYDKGYFDYERDGLGPVSYDLDQTVDAIIKAIKNSCVNDEKYSARVKNFFTYHDRENCRRIMGEIEKL